MCILLSAFLRSTLGLSDKTEIRLEEELAMIHSYLAIEKIRFGSRLMVEEEIDPATVGELVPALLLQPLVENAVIHGIANCIEPGFIRISAQRNSGNGILIAIENSFDGDAPATSRGGFGLAAVRKRLQARYGGEAELSAGPLAETYRVEVHLPAQEEARP
jgi:LytS/YehU family sensor histidine kinase